MNSSTSSASVAKPKKGLNHCLEACNHERFHQTIKYRTPDEVYRLDMAAQETVGVNLKQTTGCIKIGCHFKNFSAAKSFLF